MVVNLTSNKVSSTQRGRILKLLLDARGSWVPAATLCAISLQYSARIHELREVGWEIENRIQNVGGKRRGFFRIAAWIHVGELLTTPAAPPQIEEEYQDGAATLFDLAPGKQHRDDN